MYIGQSKPDLNFIITYSQPIQMHKKIIFSLLLFASAGKADAQRDRLDQITDSITAEAKTLYRSEWTSWYGTDVFVAKCPDKKPLSGGYFSYETPTNLVNIFFSKDTQPVVIASITFDKTFNANNYTLDTLPRKLTTTEQVYYDVRKAVSTRIYHDTTFRSYKNTMLDIVPLITNNIKKAYVLTGTNETGVVIFGYDYLVNFDDNGQITSVRKQHKSMIPSYTKTDSGKTIVGGVHNHLPQYSPFITATDICTMMLYEKFTAWKTYYVMSKDYISIWDCNKNELVILTMDAWRKINADQKERHPD